MPTPSRHVFIPTKNECIKMYEMLVLARFLGEALSKRKDQFTPIKVFTGLGGEAISVSVAAASKPEDLFAPDHRATGALLKVFTPKEIVCQDGAFAESIYGGYDFGIHIGDTKRGFIRFISDMAANVAVGAGVIDGAQYIRNFIDKKSSGDCPVLFAFLGDGAMSHGNAHSAFKFATTRKLPVVFVMYNNGLAIRTGTEYQSPLLDLAPTAAGYGMPARTINPHYDVITNWRAVSYAREYSAAGNGPYFLEFRSECRESGHSELESSEMHNYVARELRAEEIGRNPLEHFTLQLKLMRYVDDDTERKIKEKAKLQVAEAFDAMKTYTAPSKLRPAFAPVAKISTTHNKSARKIKYWAAINEAMKQTMEIEPRIRVFGEDVGSGGVHGVTKDLAKIFGPERCFHTALDENGIFGYATGLALAGNIPCPEVQFLPFLDYAAGILKHYAGTQYPVTGEPMHMVIRAPGGSGFSSNECHQKMSEAEWAHAGGFKIVCPATAYAAKGLLASALLHEKNPVIYIEQISHYGDEGIVPEELYFLPIGEACIAREGKHLSIVTYGAMMVERCLNAAVLLEKEGVSAEILDLQTIVPMDMNSIINTAQKTQKMLVVHESKTDFGIGKHIISFMSEFVETVRRDARQKDDLLLKDFYVGMKHLGAKEGPVPSHPALEKLRVPQIRDIVEAAKELLK